VQRGGGSRYRALAGDGGEHAEPVLVEHSSMLSMVLLRTGICPMGRVVRTMRA
jgi:hypothetical protein